MQKQLPFTPCLESDCDNYAVYRGRCEEHYIPWQGSTRKDRLPKDWRTRRNAVLTRDKGVCYVCGGRGSDAVDHVVPGDDHSMSNLKAIHQDVEPYCHRTKSAMEGAAASKLARERRAPMAPPF